VRYCKVLGLDFGEKTVGVAISHNGVVATGSKTIFREVNAIRSCLKELKSIVREHNIKEVVLGYPKKMDGEESARCAETLAFKEKLERYIKNINVILWDERLSTRAVSFFFDGKRENYKKHVDKMAAVYILQGYLDFKNGKEFSEMDENKLGSSEDVGEDGIVVVNDEGEEFPLQILSSREDGRDIYLLAVEPESGEVYHFMCCLADEGEDDEEVDLIMLDEEHENFERVVEMFKDEYEELGIEFEEE